MNTDQTPPARIKLPDLLRAPYNPFVRRLSQQWASTRLAGVVPYRATDYQVAINTLLLTTQSMDRTEMIITAILAQARTLGQADLWVDQEMKLEGVMFGTDRADFLRYELSRHEHVDDAMLDDYNMRLHRFIETSSPTDHDQ